MHPSTFDYLNPTDEQKAVMAMTRQHFATFAAQLDELLPDGPDKTFIMRGLRTIAMWTNVAITRQPDGSPRQ